MSNGYRFGDIEIDLLLHQVRLNGEQVSTQRKVFELLCFLIENRHRVVSKDELQDAIWPNTIVAETSLARTIMKARRAINDVDQSVIVTAHGVGYRFSKPVIEFDPRADTNTSIEA